MKCSLGICNFLEELSSLSHLLFSSISLHWLLRKAFLSLLAILWNSAFKWIYLSFSPLPFASLLFTAVCKSRGWPCTDHEVDHTLITCLCMHWSHGWTCNDHMSDHALITKLVTLWSCDCACTDHVADHTVITWVILHWLHCWTCIDHVSIMHW